MPIVTDSAALDNSRQRIMSINNVDERYSLPYV